MKYSAVVLVAAGLVAAQDPLDFFPDCAIDCLNDAVTSATSCSISEYSCQCEEANQSAIQTAATSCVVTACGADVAVSEVLPAAEEFCAAVAASGDSSETTTAETPEETATETPAEETTAEETSAEETSASETTMETSTPTASGNGTSTTTPVEVNAASGPAVGVVAALLAAIAAF